MLPQTDETNSTYFVMVGLTGLILSLFRIFKHS
ncbi:LPXTG cell wall anchor domain-containing protein [Secundilactobacillus kimchicus]